MDVVVVGCGPVGAVLGTLLAAQGVAVTVVDPNTQPYPKPRAAALDPEVLRILSRVPGLDPGAGWAVPIRRSLVRGPDHRALFAIDVPPEMAAGALLNQPALESALRAGSTMDTRFGRSVVGLDGTTVTLDDGSRVTADWVVGCDGAASTIRGLAGIGYDGVSYPEPWLVVDATTDAGPDGPPAFSYVLDPSRPMVMGTRPGAYRWEWMLLPGEDPDRMTDPAVVRELVRPWVDPDAIRIERAAVFAFHARIAARWRRERVLIAGDAAHSMPPFVGQGLGAGIRDAANLAWRLAQVVRGVDGPALLDGYERERRPDVRAVTAMALRFGRVLQTRNRALSATIRGVLRTAGAVPGLPAFAGRHGQPPVRLPRAAAGPHPTAGRWFPNARVRTEQGEGRYDELVGYRWAVVARGGDPRARLDPAALEWAEARGAVFAEDLDGALGRRASVAVIRPDAFLLGAWPARVPPL